jgi:uridine phosphorylase
MSDTFESAEIVQTSEGRQYHIGVAPGEVAPFVLLCGDPARAERVAGRFDEVRHDRRNREYVTLTGLYRGIELTVMATGIGCDNTEIAVIELSQIRDDLTLLRVGSCGGLQPEIELGDLVISTGAVRLENTSTWFVEEGFPAVAHHEVVLALLESAAELEHPHHLGITATASGFYGGQGRVVPGFPPRRPDLEKDLARMGVKNFEMECSTLFTLASLRGFRAGAVCAVYANRHANRFIDPVQKERAEGRAIETGLGAIEYLAGMDRQRGSDRWWRPSMARG